MRVIAVGRLKGGPERDLAARFLDRARAAGQAVGLTGFDVDEVAESRRGDAAERRREEAGAVLARCGEARRVVLDEQGTALSSAAFAELIGRWRDDGVPAAAFLIGGPDGHGDAVRVDSRIIGFGAMTWPHQLVRVMLAEQLYRSVTILSGHPYHRA